MIDRNVEPRIMEYLFAKAGQNQTPLSGAFEISPLCNMDCKMCYVKMTQQEMDEVGKARSLEDWIWLAEEGKKQGLLYILITGGEPFLQPYLKELFLTLRNMGMIVAINTNGTMIGEKEVEWLRQSPPNRLNITLYGASDETYERLCGNPKGFTQVTRAIELLKAAGIPIKINATMTPYNIEDFDKMVAFAEKYELAFLPAAYMFPPLRRDSAHYESGFRFSAQNAGENMVRFDQVKYSKEHFMNRAKCIEEDLPVEMSPVMEDIVEGAVGEAMRCRAGRSTFWMTWDGRMTACGIMNQPVAFPFRDGFLPAWKSIIEQTNQIHLPYACSVCEHKEICHNCAAMNMTETGGMTEKPDYVCEMIGTYKQKTLEIYHEMNEEEPDA